MFRSAAAAPKKAAPADAPVRVRSATEQSRIGFAMWCRAFTLAVLLVSFMSLIFYASTKMRNVEDVIERLGHPLHFFLFNVLVASFGVIPGAASGTSIAAGVIYGTPIGVCLVSTSCAIGAGVSFVIARYAARPLVEKLFVRDSSRFALLDQAVMRDGAQIVLLARLSPISPYVAFSYMFGLTAVGFLPFLGASAVGILPASFVYVYLGETGRKATTRSRGGGGAGGGGNGETSNVEIAFYTFGLVVTALVTYRLTVIAKATLGSKVGGDLFSGGVSGGGSAGGGGLGGNGGEKDEVEELLEFAEVVTPRAPRAPRDEETGNARAGGGGGGGGGARGFLVSDPGGEGFREFSPLPSESRAGSGGGVLDRRRSGDFMNAVIKR